MAFCVMGLARPWLDIVDRRSAQALRRRPGRLHGSDLPFEASLPVAGP